MKYLYNIISVFFLSAALVSFHGCDPGLVENTERESAAKTKIQEKPSTREKEKVSYKKTADITRRAYEKELGLAYPVDAPEKTGTRRFDLNAAPSKVQLFSGEVVNVWAYNGQVPGPILRIRLGEEIVVNFTNNLPQPTTIHWHGVRVPNAMDGVPGITQEAIPPGGSFQYKFIPKDAGTFWFHPHVRGAEQVERGLYGVLIVDDAKPLPYSRDEVWVLDDWRLGKDGQIDPRFVTRGDLAHDGRWGKMVTVNGDAAQEMKVRPGERIRLRLINTSNARVYLPDFGRLDAQVIAMDGMYTGKTFAAKGYPLAPGNRLDVDIVIPEDSSGKRFDVFDRFSRRRSYKLASIIVEGEIVKTPPFSYPINSHIPKWEEAASQPPDVVYNLNAKRGGKYGIQWTINDRPWGEHKITELEGGKWVIIRFNNQSGRLHPMHIHGQFFKILAKNGKPVDYPYFRDTILLRGKESIDIAMVPLDWGKWLMHCHILEHAEAGMMTEIHVEQ